MNATERRIVGFIIVLLVLFGIFTFFGEENSKETEENEFLEEFQEEAPEDLVNQIEGLEEQTSRLPPRQADVKSIVPTLEEQPHIAPADPEWIMEKADGTKLIFGNGPMTQYLTGEADAKLLKANAEYLAVQEEIRQKSAERREKERRVIKEERDRIEEAIEIAIKKLLYTESIRDSYVERLSVYTRAPAKMRADWREIVRKKNSEAQEQREFLESLKETYRRLSEKLFKLSYHGHRPKAPETTFGFWRSFFQ